MKKLILLCCIVLVLLSCNNDIDYTRTYTATKIETENIKLFTRNGEIKNSKQIKGFVTRHQSYFDRPYSHMLARLLEIPSELSFLSSQEAQFLSYESKALNVNVVRIKDVIYIESKDTTDTGLRYFTDPSFLPSIYDAMFKYGELYRDTIKLQGTNNAYGIIEKRCNYFTQSGNKLKMPFMNFWYFQPFSTESAGAINNTFDVKCIEMLEENDTLAIQQQQVVFK